MNEKILIHCMWRGTEWCWVLRPWRRTALVSLKPSASVLHNIRPGPSRFVLPRFLLPLLGSPSTQKNQFSPGVFQMDEITLLIQAFPFDLRVPTYRRVVLTTVFTFPTPNPPSSAMRGKITTHGGMFFYCKRRHLQAWCHCNHEGTASSCKPHRHFQTLEACCNSSFCTFFFIHNRQWEISFLYLSALIYWCYDVVLLNMLFQVFLLLPLSFLPVHFHFGWTNLVLKFIIGFRNVPIWWPCFHWKGFKTIFGMAWVTRPDQAGIDCSIFSKKISAAHQTLHETSFSLMGPKLWNCLPTQIRAISKHDSFKRQMTVFMHSVPDKPPIRGFTSQNSNPILDWRNDQETSALWGGQQIWWTVKFRRSGSKAYFVTIISKRKSLVETRHFYDPLTKISLFN